MGYLKTQGKSNGIFKKSLKSDFEIILFNIYSLSLKSNGFNLEIDYKILKDYCKEQGYKTLEVFRILKSVMYRVSS